jgi:hypothetical protein
MALQTQMPWSEPGEAAEKGRERHEVANRFAAGDRSSSGDAEADKGAALWADVLKGDGWTLERPVRIPSVSQHCFGTPDAWQYDRQAGIVRVADYKSGFLTVEPDDWQLILYASGVLDELGIDGHADQHTRVELTIVQPFPFHRDGPVRRWSVMASDLRPYINRAAEAARQALSPAASVQAGPQCRYCPARHACPAAQQAAGAAHDYAQAATPQFLDETAMAYEYEALQAAKQAIEYRLTGLEAQMIEIIKQGGDVPGWSIEPGQGRRAWTVTADEVRRLGELWGVPLTKEEPITPRQAMDAGLDKGVILSYSEVPKRAHKLVRSSTTKAAKAFSK